MLRENEKYGGDSWVEGQVFIGRENVEVMRTEEENNSFADQEEDNLTKTLKPVCLYD